MRSIATGVEEPAPALVGVLGAVVHPLTGYQTRACFAAMNTALKTKVESGA